VTNKATKAITVLITLAIIIYPFYVNASVLDVFGWVKSGFSGENSQNKVLSANTLNTVALKEEALSYPEQTIINMSLSQAVNSPEPKENTTASDKSIIEGYAFTNENNSLDGSLDSEENTSDQISLYTVRKGDTVAQIAKMFGVTSNTIYWANDLKVGTEIKPDQVIVILPITGIKYVVKKGDHVEDLAKKFKSDVAEIISFNNIDMEAGLTIGQELIIPDAEVEAVVAKPAKTKTPSKSSGIAGYFKRPVSGGRRSQGIHGNNGVDIAAAIGTPIYAAAEGTVLISKSGSWNGGYGNYIVIKHSNGTQTLYGHMSVNLVSAGTRVSKGQQIGKMGSTGRSTGSHLHFEIRGGKNPF
jgi:murein DD-endopeptidase MepM/ murein hydrolase activator NlpD